ncbi:MAG: hypothetical protein JO060_11320 [Candidatus Eremiobacteraeota bacterium]|nr:hypothetical protein [Candidatus Eremiobacteraeota bacterium]MBV9646573.1 hypothetical protein [Candidatus Eremiobacteraeota bacterium]
MKKLSAALRLTVFLPIIAIAVAPSASAMSAAVGTIPVSPRALTAVAPVAAGWRKPALIAVDPATQGLEYWHVQPGGSNTPQTLSGLHSPLLGMCAYSSLVGHGDVVIAASGNPCTGVSSLVLFYNVVTKRERTLSDPYGTASDIAIGKDSSLYVLNAINRFSNVAWYPQGSPQPRELFCKKIQYGFFIAVDNEGDIFVQGTDTQNRNAVVEFPAGPNGPQSDHCTRLPLLNEGYANPNGVAIDPKTDDLITVDDTSQCAPSILVMSIYPKPYSRKNVKTTSLENKAFCTNGPIRLNADSTIIFFHDQDLSSNGEIDSSSYPSGKLLGIYTDPKDTSPGGFTTIPNTLPN